MRECFGAAAGVSLALRGMALWLPPAPPCLVQTESFFAMLRHGLGLIFGD